MTVSQPYGGPAVPSSVPTYAYYNPATDVVAVQQSDKLTTSECILRVPWWNSNTKTVDHIYVASLEVLNQSQPITQMQPGLLMFLYSALWSLQQNLFHVADSTSIADHDLYPFENFVVERHIVLCRIIITQIGNQVNNFYGSTIWRKLGVFQWGFPLQREQLQYINSSDCIYTAPGLGGVEGMVICLPANTYGKVSLYANLSQNDNYKLQISYDGGTTFAVVQLTTLWPPQFPA
jgi:hypothetical protein